jgi:hypothetical protein
MKKKLIITLLRMLRRTAMQCIALEKFRPPRPVEPPAAPAKLRLRKRRRLSIRPTTEH